MRVRANHSAVCTLVIVACVPKVGALTVITAPGRKKSSDCRMTATSDVLLGRHAREPVKLPG